MVEKFFGQILIKYISHCEIHTIVPNELPLEWANSQRSQHFPEQPSCVNTFEGI